MAGKRKQYTPEFKFKVVLESLQRDTTLEEVCRKYSVTSQDGQPVASSLPTKGARDLSREAAIRPVAAKPKAMHQGSRPMSSKS